MDDWVGGKSNTGWWFHIFFIFTPTWLGKIPNGLKPPTRIFVGIFHPDFLGKWSHLFDFRIFFNWVASTTNLDDIKKIMQHLVFGTSYCFVLIDD